MREDMAKVLVERPRHRVGGKYPRGADRAPIEERRFHEPIKSPFLPARKSLNENLAPLRRFLMSKLGEPWDDVYSEICERINRNSAVQLHIWQHLMQEVERDPVKLEKLRARTYRSRNTQFYVDPKTLRLCRLEPPVFPPTPAPRFLVECDGCYFKQLDGIWYEVALAALEPRSRPIWDALLSEADPHHPRLIEPSKLRVTYGRPVYAIRKQQMNTKEIRRLQTKLERRAR